MAIRLGFNRREARASLCGANFLAPNLSRRWHERVADVFAEEPPRHQDGVDDQHHGVRDDGPDDAEHPHEQEHAQPDQQDADQESDEPFDHDASSSAIAEVSVGRLDFQNYKRIYDFAPSGHRSNFLARSDKTQATIWREAKGLEAMKLALKHALAAIVLLLSLAAPGAAGPLLDGVAAHRRGDYATTLRLWRPLANQGNADAQTALGGMYAKGQGVPKDYTEALKWYRPVPPLRLVP
jgi:TPR repeat protein